ncbi:XrtA system polysaccharide chain length determinant [Allopontixanthobacter sp.]|uniref:XrtA system polysaccharide chain length determinant n=1 Tax=Allopontixanthobacter sp. TaxID=2906452 RepID=UPI002ABC05B9|nr:XrtA system polysaccharide chain length determinant [Allopontixanthobacter sp.]MDZ4308062.1 XrtA system polysaccharide chain length determinant [Allopontixanthobacter sp.]
MNEVFEEFRAAAHSVWHRKWLALAIAWGVCILGWLVVALIPNSYESQARIYVQLDNVFSEQIGIAGDGERDINRVRQTLSSSVNLEKVVRSTRLGEGITSPRAMENAIATLTRNVTVKSEENNLFELSAKVGHSNLSDAENAALAQDVIQKLIDIFREENIAGDRGDVAETIVFLDQQLEARKRDLEAAEQQRLAFEAQNPELIGGSDALSAKLQNLLSESRGVDADLAAAQSALAAINGQLAGTPRTLSGAGEAGGARGALAQVKSQLASAQSRGQTDSHPDVIALKRQIGLLERQAAREGPDSGGTPNPAYSSMVSIRAEREANVQSLVARKAALQSELSALTASQASEPAAAAEANRISRDYEVLRKSYDELLKDREQLKLRGDAANERSSFRFEVIDPPTIPRVPAAPNRPLLLIGVLFAGIGAGIGGAFVIGHLRSTFATTAKLQRALGLPVLGAISTSLTEAARELQRRRLRKFAAGAAGLVGLTIILIVVEFVQRGMVA